MVYKGYAQHMCHKKIGLSQEAKPESRVCRGRVIIYFTITFTLPCAVRTT